MHYHSPQSRSILGTNRPNLNIYDFRPSVSEKFLGNIASLIYSPLLPASIKEKKNKKKREGVPLDSRGSYPEGLEHVPRPIEYQLPAEIFL